MPKARPIDEQIAALEATRRKGISRLIARENLKLARNTLAKGHKWDAQAFAHILVATDHARTLLGPGQLAEAQALAVELSKVMGSVSPTEPPPPSDEEAPAEEDDAPFEQARA